MCGVEVGPESGQHPDVGERDHQRHTVDGVTHGLALLEHRLVRLIVPAAIDGGRQAADVEVVLREVEVFLLVRRAIELDAVDRVPFSSRERRIVRGEVIVEARGGSGRVLEQVRLSGRAV
jgi:hypothetical protein